MGKSNLYRSQDLKDAASCRVRVERIRDLGKVASTRLAMDYLLGSDPKERSEALAGLHWICMKSVNDAKLYIPAGDAESLRETSPRRWRIIARRNTELFVFDWLETKFLPAYKGKSRRQILQAALDGKLRYIPRLARLRVIDCLRRYGPRVKSGTNAAEYEVQDENLESFPDFLSAYTSNS